MRNILLLVLIITLFIILFITLLVGSGAISEGFRRRRWGRRGRRWGRRYGWRGPPRWWPYYYSSPAVTTVYTGAAVPDDYSVYKNQQPEEYVTGMYKVNPVKLGQALRQCNNSSSCQAVVYDDNQDTARLMMYGNPMDLTDVDAAGIDTYIKN